LPRLIKVEYANLEKNWKNRKTGKPENRKTGKPENRKTGKPEKHDFRFSFEELPIGHGTVFYAVIS